MRINKFRQINQNLSRGEVFTPPQLVVKILSKIPKSIYLNKESKFLIPGCGLGVFMIELVRVLVEQYGYSVEDAKSRVIGIDNRIKYINYLKRKGYRVYHLDFLKNELPMKEFDVILGNPPYNGVNKQEKPWVDFYTKSYSMLKDNGLLMYITPKAWISRPDSPKFQPVSEMFSKNDLLYVNLDVNEYFNGVGEDIGFQILQKSKTDNLQTKFENLNDTFELKYEGQQIGTTLSEKIKYSIQRKVESFDKLVNIKSIFSKGCADGSTNSLKSGKFTKEITSTNYLPVLYTLNNVYYIKPSSKYNLCKKIFFNHSGYFFDVNNISEYIPIKEGYISGQNTYSIDIENDAQGEVIRHNYSRNIIIYYIDKEKTSGFNTGIPKLPWLGYDKKYTDSELYEIFGLTEEEIQEVEKYVG